jgi:predicted dehydrogenase/threonine dehydrogenase-like Zn-dependent dehydrogenase
MKQIIQDLKSGKTILENIPAPEIKHGHVLIQTKNTLVSLGTEKMLVNFGKASYIDKARQQPEKVKQVLNKIKTDGLRPTLETVFRKLNEPLPLGYCNSGVVIGVGKGVKEFNVGDRVVSNGNHAEVVNIPENLVAKIPDNVGFEDASFTVVGAIGLQGIRLINPTFGETIVVTGLGLIGLISAQILKANGCNVIGIDFDKEKLELASSWGITTINAAENDVVKTVETLTNYQGADGVLITASAQTDSIINESAQMCRKRGRVVLVGVIGLNINRSDFYDKEITFQVSCSYGPGRYDGNYEEKGLDYPIGFVRWTEKRNFEAILKALSNQSLNVSGLITEKVDLENYNQIYDNLSKKGAIASIISYNSAKEDILSSTVEINNSISSPSDGIIGIIGAGNFTSAMIVPTLKKLGANIKYIASSKGLSGTLLAKKYGIGYSTTDYAEILNDSTIDSIIITTRHNQHAKQVLEGLNAEKHVFVEKPLAININDLNDILDCKQKTETTVTVGFNRRFSPFSQSAKEALGSDPGQINVIATMNAGEIPLDHWVQDMEQGGGRIIGEACHYIDLISYFTSSKVQSVLLAANGTSPRDNTDNASILLKYENGSLGVINYFSNGSKSYPKERIEIFQAGKNIIIDNFKQVQFFGYRNKGFKKSQDKGHSNQFKNWLNMIQKGGEPIIPFDSIYNTSKASILCIESLKTNSWIDV